MTFTVAIIGRPNVGKSTLFNRLVGRHLSIVDRTAGVTRDWKKAKCMIGDIDIELIDTAGLEPKINDKLEKLSVGDCMRATRYAHVCIVMNTS